MPRRAAQEALPFRTWGGKRERAGRKPRSPGRRHTPHVARPEHRAGHPVHIVLRARRGAPQLRAEWPFLALRRAIAKASRDDFRILHYSVQPDHVHLLVEAHDKHALSRGARGLAIRAARTLNRELGRRGPLWGDRWHGRALKTPREVRNALVYVLSNFKKHVHHAARGMVDDRSSAAAFDGWRDGPYARAAPSRDGVRAPLTWLAAVGWRRHGLVSVREGPA